MNDDQAALAQFDGMARLFPLPNLVLFPHVVQGLHVFEPRYRQMMEDALAGDGLIALVLLQPTEDEEESEEKPVVASVACLGRIIWHEKLPDGRFNLRLKGLSRVRLVEEVPTDRLYRLARTELVPDVLPADAQRLKKLRRALAEAVLPRFADDGPARQQVQELFDGEMSLGHVCDVLGYALPLPLDMKQALLMEPHVDIRAEVMTQALQVSAARSDRKFPPDFSSN
jgi:Lon protease-like protein